jgi:hypothetical protein
LKQLNQNNNLALRSDLSVLAFNFRFTWILGKKCSRLKDHLKVCCRYFYRLFTCEDCV